MRQEAKQDPPSNEELEEAYAKMDRDETYQFPEGESPSDTSESSDSSRDEENAPHRGEGLHEDYDPSTGFFREEEPPRVQNGTSDSSRDEEYDPTTDENVSYEYAPSPGLLR
jgi:hypothetical protein